MPFDPVCGRHEVFGSLGAIEFSESLDRFFFIARIAADRSQRIRRKCDVVCDSETARDVPDVGVQATIFMDDQDRGQFALGIRRCHKIAAGFGITLWRRRSEEHTSELQSLAYLVCRLLLEKKKQTAY